MTGALTVLAGCWFILVIVSYTLQQRFHVWVQGTLLAFGQDIVFRAAQMMLIEALVFLPCCAILCCSGAPKQGVYQRAEMQSRLTKDIRAQHPESTVLQFDTGKVGFTYHNLVVHRVDRGSQAEVLGLEPGSRILAVDGVRVYSDSEARSQFYDAHRTKKTFSVVLLPKKSFTSPLAPES